MIMQFHMLVRKSMNFYLTIRLGTHTAKKQCPVPVMHQCVSCDWLKIISNIQYVLIKRARCRKMKEVGIRVLTI